LLELLDPKLVKFQFQVSTISRGYDGRGVFHEVPWPFMPCTSKAGQPMPRNYARGTGHSGLEKMFAAAKTGGMKKLFRRNEPRNDESQRSLLSRAAGPDKPLWYTLAEFPVLRKTPY